MSQFRGPTGTHSFGLRYIAGGDGGEDQLLNVYKDTVNQQGVPYAYKAIKDFPSARKADFRPALVEVWTTWTKGFLIETTSFARTIPLMELETNLNQNTQVWNLSLQCERLQSNACLFVAFNDLVGFGWRFLHTICINASSFMIELVELCNCKTLIPKTLTSSRMQISCLHHHFALI